MGKLESARRAVHVCMMKEIVVGRLRPLGLESCMVLAAGQVVQSVEESTQEEE